MRHTDRCKLPEVLISFPFCQTPGCKLNLFSCQSYLMPCQQSLRTSRKCMLHDVIWICLKTAKTPSNLEPKSTKRTVGLWNLRYPSPASGLPLAPDLLVTRILFKPLEGGASENEPSVERECSGKSGLAFTAMHGTYQALSSCIYIY